MAHLRKGKRDGCCGRERKVTINPFSNGSSFPFIAVYMADAQSKYDEAAEQTYGKLKASDISYLSQKE